jgi:cytochrome P450
MFRKVMLGIEFDKVTKMVITSIVFECLFGVQDVLSPEFQQKLGNWNQLFDDYNAGLFSVPINLPGFAFYRGRIAREKLVQELIPLLRELKQLYEDSGKNEKYKTALISLMETPMEDGSFLTEYEIGEQGLLLYFAGFDTTASFLTNFFKLLHDNPQAIQKARQEQLELFPQDRAITSDDLKNMPYLEACIKESMRVKSIVARVFKKAEVDIMYKDIFIPKGTGITANLCGTTYGCHKDVAPLDQFEPDRFENATTNDFVAFGIGKHTCIGKPLFLMEVKIIASLMLRHFEFTQLGESKQEYFPMAIVKNLVFDFKPTQELK